MLENEPLNDHQKFKELAALAQGRALTVSERIELNHHLRVCEACCVIAGEYSLLSLEGMAYLAADCGQVSEAEAWDYWTAQNELSSRIRESGRAASVQAPQRRASRASWIWNARAG